MLNSESRLEVISNIKENTSNNELNKKVEPGDAVLTPEESDRLIKEYLARRNKLSFKTKSVIARKIADTVTEIVNRRTLIEGMENLEGVKGGAIVTCNHFSPVDSTVIRHLLKALGRKRIYVVIQDTNLCAPGWVGFLMNYADVIPINRNCHYLQGELVDILRELTSKGEYVLIYPEQEMWFNYRKPRPLMRGAYYFAAKLSVPVISCFVEMRERGVPENEDFDKVDFTLHVLPVIYPDPSKTPRTNSIIMSQQDYQQKKAAYELAYSKPLDYSFEPDDIAGWRGDGDRPQPCMG